jgi:hypothetical protein
MSKNSEMEMRQPGVDKTGPVPVKPPSDSMPVEQLIQQRKEGQAAPPATMQPFQIVPMPAAPPSVNPGLAPAAAGGAGK